MKSSLSLLSAMVKAEGWTGTDAQLLSLCKIKADAAGFGTYDEWDSYCVGEPMAFNDWLDKVHDLMYGGE